MTQPIAAPFHKQPLRRLRAGALACAAVVMLHVVPASVPASAQIGGPPGGTPIGRAAPADPAGRALESLREASGAPVEVRSHDGFIVSMTAEVPLDDPMGDPIDNALAFLADYRDLYDLTEPSTELYPHRVVADQEGDHVFFRRRYGQLPSFNRSFGVHMTSTSVVATFGHLGAKLPILGGTRIAASKAERVALAGSYGSELVQNGESQLGVYNPPFNVDGAPEPRLVWRMTILGKGVPSGSFMSWTVYVDAVRGEITQVIPQSESYIDKDFDIMWGNQENSISCWVFVDTEDWFDGNGPLSSYSASKDVPADGQSIYNASHTIYDYFHTYFGRHSYDDDDAEIESIVHAGLGGRSATFQFTCGLFAFEDGWGTLEALAHEYSHMINCHEGELEYIYQSGALDESFADFFSAMLDQYSQPWIIGEDAAPGFGGPIRNMQSPAIFNDPDHTSSSISTDGMGFRTLPGDELNDWGGVHTNSGIPNKVASLVTIGGNHNGYSVTGLNKFKAQRLYYQVLTQKVTDSSQFEDVRDMLVQQATQWANNNQHSFQASDVCQVRNAWASVGIAVGGADTDCDGIPDSNDTDVDDDHVNDIWDNCVGLSNPLQKDIDNDGIGDACDDDKDGDGLNNIQDNCRNVPNPNQADQDSDGLGDVCDDSDGDGTKDAYDNCVNVPNEDQKDTDGDSMGNACDDDDDNDGILDINDNCPEVASLDQTDGDGDGAGDLCDNCLTTPNPSQQDCDGNGIGTECDGPVDQSFCNIDIANIAKEHVFLHPSDPLVLPHVFDEGLTQVPDHFKLKVTVETSLEQAIPMHIVDQTGRVVARSRGASQGEGAILTFAPDFEYHYSTIDRTGAEVRLPWETRYSLEFAPGFTEEEIEIDLTVEAVTP